MIAGLLLLAMNVSPPAFESFAQAWTRVTSYTTTLKCHEVQGQSVQDRTYSYYFRRPTTAVISILAGPGRGGTIRWEGGNEVTGSPPGFLHGLKVRMSRSDPRVTTLRGDTVDMASFGWLIDHFRSTKGALTETDGPTIAGVATRAITLAVSDPQTDRGLTSEVIDISPETMFPLSVSLLVGQTVVKRSIIKRRRYKASLKLHRSLWLVNSRIHVIEANKVGSFAHRPQAICFAAGNMLRFIAYMPKRQ